MKATKKVGIFFMLLAFVMSIMSMTAFAAENEGIDWEKGVIRATGNGKGENPALAHRAARTDAMRNLAEQVKGVQITAESSMKDLEIEYDIVKTRVDAIIKNMREVGEAKYYKDGYCEVVMEMPLFGSTESVADAAFLPFKDEPKESFPQPTVTTTTTTTTNTTTTNTTTVTTVAQTQYTGLIVDCSGLGLKPVMSPVIKNNSGAAIYGHKNLDYDKVIELGMASYVKTRSDAGAVRAGNNPIVVKAVSVENHNANPIVTVSDADSILIANQGAHFLDNCAVVFIR